ncbi:protein MIZU-KUSSEI 1 [Sesamum alatum]|uniref:Protein MIZU-KUSSEI 1 n=1 Tax=Sesamum alatum TaxID=300844 RepID=A0AAE1YHI2_9LAMI|nr:protein MIZU-KUSSEI 1 [Sesamum alatum]
MSRNYDNWDRLVGAVLRREQLRQLALRRSRSSSYFCSTSSSPDLASVSSFPASDDPDIIISNDHRLLPRDYNDLGGEDEHDGVKIDISTSNSSYKFEENDAVKAKGPRNHLAQHSLTGSAKAPRRKFFVMAVSKLRSALTLGRARIQFSSGLGANVVGTVYARRGGHLHFAFQDHFKLSPAFHVELKIPTRILLKEMSSGPVRIVLECDKKTEKKGIGLLVEPVWRTYCNGKKCGYATRRECGPEVWKVLNALGPISMGTGVLPGWSENVAESDGELVYMRAKFEKIVGSSDCEVFYMMNPDGNAGPELIIFLLRV